MARVQEAGDPMSHNIIALIGNPGNHWLLIIIDNRPNRMEVIYFDSAYYKSQTMISRCRFYMRVVERYRLFISKNYGVALKSVNLDETTHVIKNGKSARQKNGFDCGVYAIANVELYLSGLDTKIVSQNKLPLIRGAVLSEILNFYNNKC